VQLGIPIYGCDPDLVHLGSKSGSRETFRRAVFSFDGLPLSTLRATSAEPLVRWVRDAIPSHLTFVADVESWESFSGKFSSMHGIVECFVPGDVMRSPSVPCRIDPLQHASRKA